MSRIAICILALSASLALADGVAHSGECGLPYYEHAWTLSGVSAKAELSQENIERATKRRDLVEQRGGNTEGANWGIQRNRWSSEYYKTVAEVMSNSSQDSITSSIAHLENTLDLERSSHPGFLLLDLYRYIDEYSNHAYLVNPSLYARIIARAEKEIADWKADPLKSQKGLSRAELKLALYKLHFGRTLMQPIQVDDAYSTIISLKSTLPDAYISYVEGYAHMAKSEVDGSISGVENAISHFDRALETYNVDCAPRMAAKISYYLMGLHLDVASRLKDRMMKNGEVHDPGDAALRRRMELFAEVDAALDAGKTARSLADLMNAPNEWRAIYLRSGEVFEFAAHLEYYRNPSLQKEYEYLAKRATELALSI